MGVFMICGVGAKNRKTPIFCLISLYIFFSLQVVEARRRQFAGFLADKVGVRWKDVETQVTGNVQLGVFTCVFITIPSRIIILISLLTPFPPLPSRPSSVPFRSSSSRPLPSRPAGLGRGVSLRHVGATPTVRLVIAVAPA